MNDLVAVRFSEGDRRRIGMYANENNLSVSEVIREAVRAYISPDYGKGYLSLSEIANAETEDLTLAFSQFLDDFAHAEDKPVLIRDEPIWTKEDAGRWYFDFAAAAHKLADDNGLPVPAWCLKDEYFSKEPYWAFDTENEAYKAYLVENTPKEFAWHGLYLGPTVLDRR